MVLDPFGGSGITAMEALKRNRKVIISDLNPIASEITRLTIKPVNLTKLHEAFQKVEKIAKNRILDLYKTRCRKCSHEFSFNCAIWINGHCTDIRYSCCPQCGNEQKNGNPIILFDKKILDEIDKTVIKEWYPTNKLYHINGNAFQEKQHYESIDELFTKRNLYALSLFLSAIEQEKNKDKLDLLKIGFSSMLHLCTRITPVRPFRPISSACTQNIYCSANKLW